MTLIVAFAGRESLWLMADRRLTFDGHPPRDDARKATIIETVDGIALIGYAGLGVEFKHVVHHAALVSRDQGA